MSSFFLKFDVEHNQGYPGYSGWLENLLYCQNFVFADYVNILEGIIHIIKKNTDALVAASKETVLEVNADKNKYMVRCRDQNGG